MEELVGLKLLEEHSPFRCLLCVEYETSMDHPGPQLLQLAALFLGIICGLDLILKYSHWL